MSQDMTNVEKLLRELIALPSVNPDFLPPGDPCAGEKRMADFIAVTAARAGLDIDFQKVLPGRSNVLARLAPAGPVKHTILLAPHLDTVNAMSDDDFKPRVAAGRIYGRGSCDTKGSVAAMLTAVCQLAQERQRPASTEIIFTGLVDEESGQTGSQEMARKGPRADLAIIGEPTRLQLVTAHKGSLWIRIETSGKAAHGSVPHLGKNAAHEMARIIDVLETEYAEQLKRRRHPLLGSPTVSVGCVKGGSQPNIVPASCVAGVDRRTIPGETEASVRAEIGALLRRRGLRASLVNEKPAFCLPMETDPKLPFIQKFLTVARQKKPAGVVFFCDASVLAQGGIPSVVFGPGDIAQAHAADEWISRRSLADGTALLLKYLRSLP